MASHYYINHNQQTNGDHEVHTGNCAWLPDMDNRTYLGCLNNGVEAVAAAARLFTTWKINGCYYCCRESNTD